MYDAFGRKVWEQKTEVGEQIWNFSIREHSMAAGLYSVVLESGSKVMTARLVVQN